MAAGLHADNEGGDGNEDDDDVCLDASFFVNEKYDQRKSGSLSLFLPFSHFTHS